MKVTIVGGGLSGLSCAFELVERGWEVSLLEARPWVGGRTASWVENGMALESGLHRIPGHYDGFFSLMDRAGIARESLVYWEGDIEVWASDGSTGTFGTAPVSSPLKTLAGLLGNNTFLNPLQKAAVGAFITAGLARLATDPDGLDRVSVADFARGQGLGQDVIEKALEPMTTGLLFVPVEEYSAYILFTHLATAVPRLPLLNVGAFRGGMTDVMAEPLRQAIVARGGEVRTGAPVDRLWVDRGAVKGVIGVDGERIGSGQVVVATGVCAAQRLLRQDFADHPALQPFLSLDTTPSVTLQLELRKPAVEYDRAIFAPGSRMVCFSEQSRTTFPRAGGRLSIILAEPERFLPLSDDEVLASVLPECDRLGLPVRGEIERFKVVRLESDFHSVKPGRDHLRPGQATPVDGLTLAGDYTRQPFPCSMEGAVLSGRRAAAHLLEGRA